MKTLKVPIPEPLKVELHIAALRERKTMGELVLRWIREKIKLAEVQSK